MSDPGRKSALVVGAGGLGASAALALASGGTPRIVLADGDFIGATDLVSHPLVVERDVGSRRAEVSAAALARRFPALAIETADALDASSALELVSGVDIVVDASNRFPAMFAVNDAAAAAGRPLVHGAILRWTAQLVTVLPGETGCLRCLFEAPPPAAAEAASPGPLAALAGTLLGAEALRLLAGAPAAYAGTILQYEARSARARKVPLPRRGGCPACGGRQPARPAGGFA